MLWLIGCFILICVLISDITRPLSAVTNCVYRTPRRHDVSPLPSIPFEWPNGQGTDKFFGGVASARQWREQYGPMYRIWSGWRPEIVLTQPHQVDQFYRDSQRHIKAKNNNSGWLFGEVLGECVGLLSLGKWQNLRKYVEQPFSRPAAMRHCDDIVQQSRAFVAELGIGTSKTIDPAVDLQLYPFMVVGGILFGPLSSTQREKLVKMAPVREELFKEVIKGGINRIWLSRYLPLRGQRLLRDFGMQWESFVAESYEKALVSSPEAPVVTLWQAMQRGAVSKREVLQTLDESLYANLDVTTSALSWNVVLLAQNVSSQKELRKEIEAHREGLSEYINRSNTFLASVVIEAARLRPILAFSNPEAATEDKVIDGHLIPKGTNVIIDAMALNVENPFWSDGRRYDPARHLRLKPAEARKNMWRFGPGPRVCLGQHIAERMLRAMLAELLSQYQLSVADATRMSASLDDTSAKCVAIDGESSMGGRSGDGQPRLQEESWVGLPQIPVLCTTLPWDRMKTESN